MASIDRVMAPGLRAISVEKTRPVGSPIKIENAQQNDERGERRDAFRRENGAGYRDHAALRRDDGDERNQKRQTREDAA